MNLDSNDKTNILLVSLLFILVVIVSIFVSFTRQPVHSFIEDTNVSYPNMDDLNMSNEKENCTFCDDHNITSLINQKIQDSGLNELFNNQQNLEKISLDDFPDMNSFNSSLNCTPLFPFIDSIKYLKKYKYTFTNENVFYLTEKFNGKLNDFYTVESTYNLMVGSGSYDVLLNSYYTVDGDCVYSEYSSSFSSNNQMQCTGNYNTFLCDEFIDNLMYLGEEKYYVYGANYDVYVYASSDNSTILKYGKSVPILFYMEQIDEDNKYLRIELLSVEEG